MQITADLFGQHDGQDVHRYTITNAAGNFIQVSELGATWTNFNVNDHPLIVHFDKLSDYETTASCLGMSIGRVAGRITKAQAPIDGKEYHFEANENDNTLHGGPHGFASFVWHAEQSIRDHDASVTFSRNIASTEDHFPGDLDVRITYTFNDDNDVTINFSAASTAATLFNPTCHVYWNLTEGQKSLKDQLLKINSSRRLDLASDKVPTGKFTELAGTGYDFSKGRDVPDALADIKSQYNKDEIDDIYEVKGSATEPIAVLSDKSSKRHVAIYSERNGLVVFTSNPFDDSKPYNALATEAQTLPDAPNHEDFGDISLNPGELKSYSIKYHYYEE
ncbi:galactose mutarotase [Lactobacillus sp. LC28-10]|uniref:Galactose mutarotase n=1 Tax=Secundilactobacillus angelensis TaxID=2722706 RepID=A0ABX1KXJ3_9LACO|nr:aldose epimerase family protein [Secundilactobacillus angelensis]MCH5461709.1 galactose mutarotase [Secundilactobacillus angelensis]NLR18005.1 galactose mutarotase [Secundilactobacillus angelensis]